MKLSRCGTGPRSIRWRASAPVSAFLAGFAFLPAIALAQVTEPSTQGPTGSTFTITEVVIVPGGVTRSQSPCFDLSGATAQPVAGPVSGDTFEVYSGFWGSGASTDTLFRNGFEVCQP